MKKIVTLLLAIAMLCGLAAFAEEAATDTERNYAPESGTGWMIAVSYTHLQLHETGAGIWRFHFL